MNIRTMKGVAVAAAAGSMLALAGCASGPDTPRPMSSVSEAKAAVQFAERVDAPQLATTDYNRARDKLDRAQAAMNREDYASAKRLAEQAEADAELAEVRARNQKTQRAVNELQRSIDTLRVELERAG